MATVLIAHVLVAGCSIWHGPPPVSPKVVDAELTSRVLVRPDLDVNPAESVVKPGDRSDPSVDPSAPGSEPTLLSLADAIAYALRNHPRLRSTQAAIERAASQEQVAFAHFLPQVQFYGQDGVTSFNQGTGIIGATGFILTKGIGTYAYAQEAVALEQLVSDFGRTGSRYRQAVARERIAELQRVRAEQTVAFDVTTAYVNVLLARASRRVQEDAFRLAESVLKDTQVRRRAGTVYRDEVLRAEVQVAMNRSGVVSARETEFDSLARLNNTLGRNAACPLKVLDLRAASDTSPSLAESLAKAADFRPEIELARQALVAAGEGLGGAAAEFRPRIYVRGSAGRVDGAHILTGWQEGIGLHIEAPLYTGGQLRGELRAAEAEVRATLADAQAVLNSVSLEVSLAYRRVVAAAELLRLARIAVVEAEEGLRLVQVRYRNGNAILTNLVDVEAARTRAQQNLYLTIYAQLAALADLNYALGLPQGGSFKIAEPSSEPEKPPAEERRPAPEEPPRPRPPVLPEALPGGSPEALPAQ
ncbi:MAG: TolC family protein [Planctomycetaceae bacterium]|nr:TolC family protein [Planctomycetaceae bacterium]